MFWLFLLHQSFWALCAPQNENCGWEKHHQSLECLHILQSYASLTMICHGTMYYCNNTWSSVSEPQSQNKVSLKSLFMRLLYGDARSTWRSQLQDTHTEFHQNAELVGGLFIWPKWTCPKISSTFVIVMFPNDKEGPYSWYTFALFCMSEDTRRELFKTIQITLTG